MTNNPLTPSVFVGTGEIKQANYRDAEIPSYRGNPLIEALPPILDQDNTSDLLERFPVYSEAHRKIPAHLRLHLIQDALQLFIPLPVHFDLEQRFSRMIRVGYQARNPALRGFWGDINNRVQSLGVPSRTPPRSTATGFTIVGISGVGKTTSVEAILSLYPQVIIHNRYLEQDFNFIQIVWLKLDCPFDGSIKGLCLNFFQAVDDLLGTRYYDNYASGRKTVDQLLPCMAKVASLHSIGVLVIDEIQHLSQAKSGGSSKMLNFFVQLINTIGLPVVLVGTYKAMSVLCGEFRQTRRGTGQGDLVWDRMKKDESWEWFLECLWEYQYVQQPSRLDADLSNALYDVTQGITDFAIKVYMLAQVKAIVDQEEIITSQNIRQAAQEGLRMANPILKALKENDIRVLSTVEDVYPMEIDSYLSEVQSQLNKEQQLRALSRKRNSDVEQKPSNPSASTVATPSKTQAATTNKRKSKGRKRSQPLAGSLPDIAAIGEKQNLTAYDALKQVGCIRSANEYLVEEVA